MSATKEDLGSLNDKLIDAFQQSFSQLKIALQSQNETTHSDLLAVQSAMKTTDPKPNPGTLGRLPTFDGTCDQALEFLEKFNFFAEFYKWNDEQRLRAFPLTLTSNASHWFFSIDKKYSSFKELSDLFKAHFLSKTNDWVLRHQLSARKQRPAESITDFATDIKRLCQRLAIPSSEQTHYFLQGLHPAVREHVILNQPKTLDQAISLASIKQSVIDQNPTAAAITAGDLSNFQNDFLKAVSSQFQPKTATSINAIEHAQPNRENNTTLEDRIVYRVTKAINNKLTPNPTTNYNLNTKPRFSDQRNFSRSTRTTDGVIVCHGCRKVGHYRRNCPENSNPPRFFRSQGPNSPTPQRSFPPSPHFNRRPNSENYQRSGNNGRFFDRRH